MRSSRGTALVLLAALVLPLLPASASAAAEDGVVVVPRTAPAQSGEQTLVARVEQVVQEREPGVAEQESTLLVTAGGRREVVGDALDDVPPGTTLEVTVVPAGSGDVRVLAAETTDAPVPTAPAAPTSAATHVATPTVTTSDPTRHDVYVVMHAPLGTVPDAAATATVRTAVERAADFWTAETRGAVRLNVAQVVGWNTTSAVDCRDVWAVWGEAERRSAFRPGRSTHLLVYTPSGSACPYGIGTVGGDPHAGGISSVRALDQSLVAHELGHNLSLGHSGALTCPTGDAAWAGAWPTGCAADDYGDYADVMGASGDPVGLGSVNVVHLQRLGVLGERTVVVRTPAATRTVVLDALSSAASGRALRVVDPKGESYWVEHRSADGRDLASSRVGGLTHGVRILRHHPTAGGASLVLDASPTQAGLGDRDRPLKPGRSFRSASGWTTITVDVATSATASVTVRLADPAPPVVPTVPPTTAPTLAPTTAPTVAPTTAPPPPPAPIAPPAPAPPAPAPPAPAPPAPAPPAPAPPVEAPAPAPVSTPTTPAPAPSTPAPSTPAPAPAPLAPAPEAPALAPVVVEPLGPPTAQPAPLAPAAPPVVAPAAAPTGTSADGTRDTPARLLLDAPDRTAVGSTYAVRGRVLDADGAPVAGTAVQLLHQAAGATTWRRIRTARTDATGGAAFSVRAVAGAAYRLTADGSEGSAVERVQVAAALALGSVPSPATRGRAVLVTGRTTAAPGTVVVVEVLTGARVVRRSPATVLPDGRLTGRVVLPRGTYAVRLARRTTPALLGSTTAPRSLRVR